MRSVREFEARDVRKPTRWPTLRREAESLGAALPPLLVEAERVAATVAQGVHGRRRVGTGESFWQFRRYSTGDPAQLIDWRQSAKSQHYFIRENEWEAAESVWLWRDSSPSMSYLSRWSEVSKRDRASVLALALASLLVRGGERIAALEEADPPSANRLALRRLALRYMSLDEDGISLPPERTLPRYAQLVLFSDFLVPLEDLRRRVEGFGARGIRGHLLQILDPAEEDLPFEGRTRFEGVEEPLTLVVGRAQELKADYRAALAAQRAALADVARRLGWTFLTHRTDRPPQLALLALYGALAGERGLGLSLSLARGG
jgi:uncharacterized protein (DUF58 family)